MKKIGIIFMLVGIGLAGYAGLDFWWKKNSLNFLGTKRIVIVDDGFRFETETEMENLAELAEKELKISEDDVIYPERTSRLLPGMTILVFRAKPVTILADGGKIEKKVLAFSVADALSESGVVLSHLDKVDPGRKSPVVAGAQIEITRINVEKLEKEEPIDFEVVEKEDGELRWRKKEVKQPGEKGVRKVVYEITYKNGKETNRKKLSSEVTKKPVTEMVSIGTKVEVGQTKTGVASWYRFRDGMFCASRMFPRGTWLRVTNRATGKKIFVQVNDFGPQRGTGKMIDLDAVAFEKLSPLGAGVIEVKVEEILE